ncbi:tRNA (N(6)-L-threonylcarbamoyladenosine(37)-C(2))-methylthiotransferase MtaB [Kangiella sediminilitoris]|uniref:tRNA modifying enzyme n=1 Tax=Kangiella sediminilitoris TaxID=1144748 RepID=A0A1B3BBT4_9GAMM|nr:tRNA (N(6)-L-threonylcarbamoyladenosine(37)-C(2))-methylthiotransferase MtaB [Kangiella sediminilitoris]AOE50252.1 tRNA modifying enzyme [Kangiella sediminilitoris]
MQVHLSALGCRLNEAELQNWATSFQKVGYSLAATPEVADLIVLNTCAVTAEAARKSRQTVRRFHRSNPEARMVVTGCYASLEPEKLEQIMGVDLVVDNSDKDVLVDKVKDVLDMPVMPEFATEPGESALFARNRERAFIKIQDGCRYRCTYCIVTVARGEEKSRTIDNLIEEINQLHEGGIQEIVLAGVHVGGYGSDIDSSLYELVQNVLDRTDMPRIRFASVEPWDLGDNFFELFANPRLMAHMHLPIQSGADSVLRRMSRRCRTEDFEALVNEARTQVPGFNVTTDVIVGFPGETDEEFEQTMEYIEKVGFGHIHIFTYSDREGTKAARLPNKITKEVKKERSRRLHELAAILKAEELASQVGQTVEVLWESSNQQVSEDTQRFYGYTPNYHKVAVDVPLGLSPERLILKTKLVSVDEEQGILMGDIVEDIPSSSSHPNSIKITQL